MKLRVFLLSALFLGINLIHPVTAKADLLGDILGQIFGNGHGHDQHPGQGGHGGTALPINNNIAYLLIAGLCIGIYIVRQANRNRLAEQM